MGVVEVKYLAVEEGHGSTFRADPSESILLLDMAAGLDETEIAFLHVLPRFVEFADVLLILTLELCLQLQELTPVDGPFPF